MVTIRAGGWTLAVLLFVVAPTAWTLVRWAEGDGSGPLTIEGVRLGMSATDVRRAFLHADAGTFRAEALGEDAALVWAPGPRAPAIAPRAARFELHLGLLVAVRMDVPAASEAADGPRFDRTPGSVLVRQAAEGVTKLTLLSRDCPTHAAEVRRIEAEHPR